MREPLFIPESMGVLDLLARMRSQRIHLAIVVDEFGGTEGLVTIEDVVEEIVGEIEDEHDIEEEGMLTLLDDGVWEADARIELEELAKTVDRPADLGRGRGRYARWPSVPAGRPYSGARANASNILPAGSLRPSIPTRARSFAFGSTRRTSTRKAPSSSRTGSRGRPSP